jgi:hypothetical protein
MTQQEIEERYNKAVTAIKALEQLLKAQETSYDNHLVRLGWLKHFADSAVDLKRLETEFLKISQATAAQAAARQTALANAAPVQPVVPVQPVAPAQPAEAEEEAPKKPKKKL